MFILEVKNEKQTKKIAEKLSEFLFPGTTIILNGDLGAGKTTFTKGLGAGLGVKRVIKSPTYTIIREYTNAKLPLYHIDLYRLNEGEAADLGLYEYFSGDGVSVIEWPSVAPEELPSEYLEIEFEVDLDEPEKRTMKFKANGKVYRELLKSFKENI